MGGRGEHLAVLHQVGEGGTLQYSIQGERGAPCSTPSGGREGGRGGTLQYSSIRLNKRGGV